MKKGKFLRFRFVGILAFIILAVGAVVFFQPQKSHGGTIGDIEVSVSDLAKSATASYTISFTPENDIPRWGGRINVQFQGPGGYYNNTSSYSYQNFNNATVDDEATTGSIYFGYSNWNGATFYTNDDIDGGTEITIKVNNVINPSQEGYFFAHVWTSNYYNDIDGSSNWGGDYNSDYFEIGTADITGTITDSDEITPVKYANVYLTSTSGNYSYFYTYTDGDGKFGIGDIPEGTYNFSVYSPPTYNTSDTAKSYFPPATSQVTISSSPLTKNTHFLAATKTVSGSITKGVNNTAVTTATVYAYKMGGNGYVSKNVDGSGNFTFPLTGGSWYIGIYSTTWPSDWYYSNYNEMISFVDDDSTETVTKNFNVESVDSVITGYIKKPDGSSPTQYSTGLSFSGEKNRYFYASVESSGYFTTKVVAGTYSINGWNSDQNYAFPKVENFTVGDSETKDLGTITLVEKTDSITGVVRDNLGSVVSGASISAWKNDGTYDYGYTTSASDGTYTIKVTPGTWQISAYPQWNSGYIFNGKPQSMTVTSGTQATKDFVFQKCTVTINGTITDPDGNVLTQLYSWISAGDGSSEWGYTGTSVDKGNFTLKLPAGTWDISAYIYGVDYGSPDVQRITVSDNETKTVTMAAVRNDVTITGTIYDENNSAVTGKYINIYGTKGKNASWQNASVDQTNGTYSMKVSAGTWRLGWWIDQNLGYSAGNSQDIEFSVAAGETKTQNINLKKLNATIKGKATRSDGTAMQWAWITADSRNPSEKTSADMYYYSNGAGSDSSGNYEFKIPAGTYWVGGSMWPGSGVINPKRQKVVVEADGTATVDLTFRAADSTISGNVSGGASGSAFITAWSEDGGYSETNSSNAGDYSLSVSSGTIWHVKAMQKDGNDAYKSLEYIIDMTSNTLATQNLELAKQSFSLPDSVSVTFNPTVQQTINLEDETVISIPANTLGTTQEKVTMTIEPDIELAEEPDAKPLDYGYNIDATTESGEKITSFQGLVTIEDKYSDESILASKAIDDDQIEAAYYNEANGTWDELVGVVNTEENTVTYQTNHFSKFALVTGADTIAPAAPTNVSITTGDERVTLNWTKPSDSDLAGTKIYRSTQSGVLGDLVTTVSNPETVVYTDTGLTNGTAYYYTVRSYDVSGNISPNVNQVVATPAIMPITGSNILNWATMLILLGLCIFFGKHYIDHHIKEQRFAFLRRFKLFNKA